MSLNLWPRAFPFTTVNRSHGTYLDANKLSDYDCVLLVHINIRHQLNTAIVIESVTQSTNISRGISMSLPKRKL